ncbi:unnamed protein product [Adineta steineri]|uniref:Chitin-binding type-2 domain-containing protein n=1 Tax=Adineta steineri TaxID=433720 RepID=A0A814MIY8_9BILA|nr:unnamed protein product [Adineta steineri]CAF3517723.1 unnamed protein product [Adineta steineri]
MSNQSDRRLFYFIKLFLFIQLTKSETFKCVKDGFFPDKKDCWIYHICVGTTHSVKACKEDLLFNPNKNECDWAMNVNCSQRSYEDTLPATIPANGLSPPGSIYFNPSSAGENIDRPKYLTRYPEMSDSILEHLCRTIDDGFIAHPTDCKRYAYCANGVPQTKVCKKGLLWSQHEKMCVWPVQSDCPLKDLNPEPSEETKIYASGNARGTMYPPSYSLPNTQRPNPSSNTFRPTIECPPSQSWRVPDPFDCSIYHECYQGTDILAFCPAQLLYNPEKQICDYPPDVQCKNKCTSKNEGARFVDLSSCCHFLECVSGKLITQTCTHPNSFDIQTRTCLPYKRVKCDGRRQCLSHYLSNYDVGKSLCDFVPSCAGHSDGYYLDRTKPNCQAYIQCLDNRVVNHSRCSHGQRFNRNMGRCAPADQVPCRATSSISISLFSSILVFILLIASNIVL